MILEILQMRLEDACGDRHAVNHRAKTMIEENGHLHRGTIRLSADYFAMDHGQPPKENQNQ
jgi:ribosomal protein S12 methylthiotransferase accessory factor YcaO